MVDMIAEVAAICLAELRGSNKFFQGVVPAGGRVSN